MRLEQSLLLAEHLLLARLDHPQIVAAVERGEVAALQREHVGGAPLRRKQRHLAKRVARPLGGDHLAVDRHLQVAAQHNVEPVGNVARTDEQLVGRRLRPRHALAERRAVGGVEREEEADRARHRHDGLLLLARPLPAAAFSAPTSIVSAASDER